MTSGPKPGAETDRLHLTYDAWNRLVAAYADDEGEAGNLIAEYQYDGQGRRIAKIVREVDGETVTYERTDYQYDEAWQVLEERSDSFEVLGGEGGALETPAETPGVQWLWDVRYVDTPVLRWRDADLDSETGYLGLEETLYVCNDANMNVTALIDRATGEAVERYVYDPYGKATFYDGDWQPTDVEGREDGAASAYSSEILYCGYRFDPETGLDHVRYRYYHPTLGRWIERDPIEYASGMDSYDYGVSCPTRSLDPTGLQAGWLDDIEGTEVDGLAMRQKMQRFGSLIKVDRFDSQGYKDSIGQMQDFAGAKVSPSPAISVGQTCAVRADAEQRNKLVVLVPVTTNRQVGTTTLVGRGKVVWFHYVCVCKTDEEYKADFDKWVASSVDSLLPNKVKWVLDREKKPNPEAKGKEDITRFTRGPAPRVPTDSRFGDDAAGMVSRLGELAAGGITGYMPDDAPQNIKDLWGVKWWLDLVRLPWRIPTLPAEQAIIEFRKSNARKMPIYGA